MYKIIFLIQVLLFSICAAAEPLDFSVATGVNYYDISTSSNYDSKAYVSDMMARIEADWMVLRGFFIGASGTLPVFKEHSTETVYHNDQSLRKNSFYFGEKNLQLYGGYQMLPLFNPFLGFSVSELSINRNPRNISEEGITQDQSYSNYDFLLGFKGTYEFNDYTSMGYSLSYQTSANSDAKLDDRDFKNVDSSKMMSAIYLKYWLPNEIMQVGLHLYGGKSMYDSKSSANELLPDTDIKFVGAFLSFKVNL